MTWLPSHTDALVAAINFNLFHQHAERVRLAASAQAINVLQALILTSRDEMVLTPTYHVFDMYKAHRDATSIASGRAVTSRNFSASADAV